MVFKQLRSGGDRNFSYFISDERSGQAAVVDPGNPPDAELALLADEAFTLAFIINTHDHLDHTGGNAILARKTGAKIAMHESASSPHDIDLADGGKLTLGGLELIIIHTPGHTRDSICILADSECITGDTLFVGKVGGTGFGEDAHEEYESLHRKLMTLPPETRVWPGHDYGVCPSSTIGEEIASNPFLLRPTFESFVELKMNWAEYKRTHGIK